MIQWVALHFQKTQMVVLAIVVIATWMSVREKEKSRFKVREADRSDLDRIKAKSPNDLANAKLTQKKSTPPPPPLALPGIRLHGEPHEVLGVRLNATEAEIMKAYKDAMKQFHPDRIQGPAQNNLKFYEEAAGQLNWAKEKMMLALKQKS
jgi:DnaJ-domain-containing protein 1